MLNPTHAVCLALVACAGCADQANQPSTFVEAFPEVKRITLAEDPTDPIVEITALAVAPNGDLIVTDQPSSKVRVFDDSGALLRTLGGRGDAPGELDGPTWAAPGPDGEIRVVEQGSPRLTSYGPNDSVTTAAIPGHYGFWIAHSRARWVVGAATRSTRFATLPEDGVGEASYGATPEAVNNTPFWVFFAKDRGVVLGDHVWTNNSFYPSLRIFDLGGTEVTTVGSSTPQWIEPSAPPIDRISQDGDRARLEAWSRTFTVVSGLAGRGDSLVFVQVGRHDPADQEPYYVEPAWVTVYDRQGSQQYEELALSAPILAGGDFVYVLAAQPPDGWVLTLH